MQRRQLGAGLAWRAVQHCVTTLTLGEGLQVVLQKAPPQQQLRLKLRGRHWMRLSPCCWFVGGWRLAGVGGCSPVAVRS